MRVAFRADASLEMGSGHVMRCLTLADALSIQGADCFFICRHHQGNLIDFIRDKGFRTKVLPLQSGPDLVVSTGEPLAHAAWLGSSQELDAADCACILAEEQLDWLIVDHYALDARWERALKPYYRKLMVIDDLADRPHQCDLLLDQTLGRDSEDYRRWIPANCKLLCGSNYALLRPEFEALRSYSLKRRARPQLRQLLVTMGGVDKNNVTGQVLEALRGSPLPAQCQITVVMGATAPWLSTVSRLAESMPWSTTVKVGVSNMAKLMADSDLAIGAAGATSWERCCLGLPTIMLVLAENQLKVARELESRGAALCITASPSLDEHLCAALHTFSAPYEELKRLSDITKMITAGIGVESVILKMRDLSE